jgi:hypothetical protein
MGKQGRRHKQLLDDWNEIKLYRKLKAEALDCTVCRTQVEEAMDLLYDTLCNE